MILVRILVVLLFCGLVFGCRYLQLLRCEERARDNLHCIQIIIESWKVQKEIFDYQTVYPTIPSEFEAYINAGLINEKPINPFTGEPIRLIPWGETPSPGDVTFLLAREYFMHSDQEDRYTETDYQLITYSVRRHVQHLFIDADGDGYTDPAMLHLTGGCCSGPHFDSAPEGLEDTLARLGYTEAIDSPLPDDNRLLWRFMFFLNPAK